MKAAKKKTMHCIRLNLKRVREQTLERRIEWKGWTCNICMVFPACCVVARRWIAFGLSVLMLVASLLEALTVNVYFNILFR